MSDPRFENWLVMDAGGTTCRLMLARHGVPLPDTRQDFPTRGDPALLCAAYLAARGARVAGAVLAGAGPVLGDRLALTNADVVLDAAELRAALGLAPCGPVHLVNDLVAQAHGLDGLPPDAGRLLVPGTAQPDRPRLLAGIGTGLNAAVLHGRGDRLFVPASEAGQIALPAVPSAPGNRHGADLPGVAEDLLSGPGLLRLHHQLTGQDAPAAMAAAHPATRALWTAALGAWLADMALVHLPLGGIWLAGGVIAGLADRLDTADLARGLHRGGAFGAMLAAIPVRIIAADDLALRGCARLALHLPRA